MRQRVHHMKVHDVNKNTRSSVQTVHAGECRCSMRAGLTRQREYRSIPPP